MNRRSNSVGLLAVVIVVLSASVFGQRITGNIRGTVTDPSGAVVPGASVTITGVDVGYMAVIQTDKDGRYSVRDLRHGDYRVTAKTTADSKVVFVTVSMEKTTTADITFGTVTSVSSVPGGKLGGGVDTTDSKTQTIVPLGLIKQFPSGASFDSLLKVSAGIRFEPLSGGFQSDGASGAENTFFVNGQRVDNFRTGILNPVFVVPTALISEIQIKTAGFEAEHFGSSGAVISIDTDSGTDRFAGEFGSSAEPSRFQAGPRFIPQRFVASSSSQAAIDSNPQFVYGIQQPRDRFMNSYPYGKGGGPLIPRHLWFFGAYAPQIFDARRTSMFFNSLNSFSFSTGNLVLTPRATQLTPIDYRSRTTYDYAFARIDWELSHRLTGMFSYLWNPSSTRGNIPFTAISTSNPTNVFFAGTTYTSGDYAKLQGGRTSANTLGGSLTWKPISRLTLNSRYGRTFLNEKTGNYAVVDNTRFICAGSSSAYFSIATGCPGGFGYQSLNTNSLVSRDVSLRNELNLDASYEVRHFGGNHLFKGGYQSGWIKNDVLSGNAGTGTVTLFYGQDYAQAGTGAGLPCALGTASCIGVGVLNRVGMNGVGRSRYQAIYFQDQWQPFRRLTLNLGVRAESEVLPSFDAGEVFAGTAIPDIKMDFGKKTAPRLGLAYDVTGDGKTKIFASYGWFYDRMKFEFPRNVFGANFFRNDYFPITAANPTYSFYTPSRILGGWKDPAGGGNPSTAGGLSQLQRDFRIPSNLTPAQFAAIGVVGYGADPDLKPFRQDEMTAGIERKLGRNYLFSARYTHKNLVHAIEDHAILGLNEAENYPIGNPGEGLDLKLDQANGTAKSARPLRVYDGLEVKLSREFSKNYFYTVNYTLSRLYGNYSGLASSDENGRLSPNSTLAFNYPINGFTATGSADNGDLPTDRRHAFKAFGGYTWDWFGSKSHRTDLSFYQTILQGTPQTTFIQIVATSIPLSKRGDLGRSPTYWQTDLAFTQRFMYGPDKRFMAAFDMQVMNAFNNDTVLLFNTVRYRTQNSILASDISPTYNSSTQTLIPTLNLILNGQIGTRLSQLENGGLPSLFGRSNPHNVLYGQPALYQVPRSVRVGFRIKF